MEYASKRDSFPFIQYFKHWEKSFCHFFFILLFLYFFTSFCYVLVGIIEKKLFSSKEKSSGHYSTNTLETPENPFSYMKPSLCILLI